MPRRYRPEKRIAPPDPIYNDAELQKFMNRLMIKGKKSTAERIMYNALENLKGKTELSPLEVFHDALKKARPRVKVKARRVGGSTYQVPIEIEAEEGMAIGSRWLISNARKRAGRSMVDKLSNELLDAYNGTGATIKKRDETHRMAEANKAFSHYRF